MDVEQAAARLGVSPDAVRKRLRRGTLPGVKTAAGWDVQLATDAPLRLVRDETRDETQDATRDADETPRDARETPEPAFVAHLLDEIASLRQALERSQQGEAELRRLLAAEQQRLLPAPVDAHAATLHESPATGAASTPADSAPRRPWWAFWRAGAQRAAG
jgi:hypothetical protein